MLDWLKPNKKIVPIAEPLMTSGLIECPERPGEYLKIGGLHRVRMESGQILWLFCSCYDEEKGIAIFTIDKGDPAHGFILHKEVWWFRVLDLVKKDGSDAL